MHTVKSQEENLVIDGADSALVAYRLSHAVSLLNRKAGAVATLDIFARAEDAEPPIAASADSLDQVFHRLTISQADDFLTKLLEIELELSYIDNPHQPSSQPQPE